MKYGLVIMDFSEDSPTPEIGAVDGAQLTIKLVTAIPANKHLYVSHDPMGNPDKGYILSSPKKLTEDQINIITGDLDDDVIDLDSLEKVDSDVLILPKELIQRLLED